VLPEERTMGTVPPILVMRVLFRTTAIISMTIFLTTITVNAVDMNGDWSHTMLGMILGIAGSGSEQVRQCPVGMTYISHALEPFCIDTFEASPGVTCHYQNVTTESDALLNIAERACVPASRQGAYPWRHVSQHDARQLCSRVGKRLPTAGEWYMAALGTSDPDGAYGLDGCNVARNRADGVAPTGGGMRCVSDSGVYDMIGNMWEWVDEEVVHGHWNGRAMPQTGYVHGADKYGMAYETSGGRSQTFSGDRFWSNGAILAGVMRGGYYDSTQGAGVFSVYAASPPEFVGGAVGFRCAAAPYQTKL